MTKLPQLPSPEAVRKLGRGTVVSNPAAPIFSERISAAALKALREEIGKMAEELKAELAVWHGSQRRG